MELARYVPIAGWLPQYDRTWFKSDLAAGLTVWALVVPQAIAYAQIAGLPPQAGVFASFAAPLGYALFGTSRQLICSPTSATAALSAALVAPVVLNNPDDFREMSAALAILCGVAFFLLAKLKMGFVSQFIASAVQTGFLFGLGLTIILGQLFTVFGIDGIDGPFYKQAWHFLKHLDETVGWTLAVGGVTFALVFILGRTLPKLPVALVMVALSIVVSALLDLNEKGVAIVGSVDRAVPLPALPLVNLGQLLTLVPGALAIVVVGYSESISVAKRFADEHQYTIRPDQELTALGVSSAFGGFFHGFITGGGASQSAANDRAGAKTQMSSIVLAIAAAITSIALMPLFKELPLAVLSAIVINAVMGFVNLPAMRRIVDLRRDSFVFAVLALLGVLFIGILPGLLIAVILSLILLLARIGRPETEAIVPIPGQGAAVAADSHPDLESRPGLLMLRPDLPLLFVNVAWIRDDVKAQFELQQTPPDVVVLDLEATDDVDVSTLDMLESLARDLASQGAELWLSNVHARTRDMLERGGLLTVIGPEHVFATASAAQDAFDARHSSNQEQGARE